MTDISTISIEFCFRQRKNHEKFVQVLNEKHSSVHDQIISKNIEANFINKLKTEHPHLALQMNEIQEKNSQNYMSYQFKKK